MHNKQGSVILWVIAVVVVGTVLGGSFYVTKQSPQKGIAEQQATTTEKMSTSTEVLEEESVTEDEEEQPTPPASILPQVILPPPPTVPTPVIIPEQEEATSSEEIIVEPVVEEPVIEKVHIFADDDGANPSIVSVTKGNTVELTFEVSTSNVRFGGLLFKSEDLNSGDVLPGESKTITFIAETSQSFGVFWPSSNHRKPYNVNINVVEN